MSWDSAPTLWDDIGPISQGKIITAILQDRPHDARNMLGGWSDSDLDTLFRAAVTLQVLISQAKATYHV